MSYPYPVVASGGGIYYGAKSPKQFFELNFIALLIALGIGAVIYLVFIRHVSFALPQSLRQPQQVTTVKYRVSVSA